MISIFFEKFFIHTYVLTILRSWSIMLSVNKFIFYFTELIRLLIAARVCNTFYSSVSGYSAIYRKFGTLYVEYVHVCSNE